MRQSKATPAEWSAILVEAVSKPGMISEAYSRFWNYSVGNQLLALFQCYQRGIPPAPINTFMGWKELGRHVKKGEKAITLCMPVTIKRKSCPSLKVTVIDPDTETNTPDAFTAFLYKPNWFVLSQTEGVEYQPTDLPEWKEEQALKSLGIERIPFAVLKGNCQGYAVARQVAVSPLAFLPHKTLFHELAHVVLGHTRERTTLIDNDTTPRNIREVEAESVALICCESLGLAGPEYCRGYIQHWMRGVGISEKTAQRIFKAADRLLKAGMVG